MYLPSMMVELAAYGVVTGFLTTRFHTKTRVVNLYGSLIAAMLIGRVLAGLTRALIVSPGRYTLALWASGYFVTSLPGILLQLLLIPVIMVSLEKSRLIPTRSTEV